MIVYFEKWTRRYWPTQAEGKEAERQAKPLGGERAGIEKIDVPTTEGREALCEFLNNLEDAARNAAEGETGVGPDPTDTPDKEQGESLAERQWTVTDIEDFILNRATVNEVGNLLSRLGTRFAELVQEKRHG